jgi:hypothetical protein
MKRSAPEAIAASNAASPRRFSPACSASLCDRAVKSAKASAGDAHSRPTTHGPNTLSSRRARCSAPQVGKLHQISP